MFFIGMVSTIIMLLLLPTVSFCSNRKITGLFIVLYSLLYFFIIQYGLTINDRLEMPLFGGAFILILYLTMVDKYMNQTIELNRCLKIILFIMVPTILCILAKTDSNEICFSDILILILILTLTKSRFINQKPMIYKESTIELYGTSMISKALILLIFLGYRRISIDLFWINTVDVWIQTLVCSALSCFFALYMCYKIGYLSLNTKKIGFKNLIIIAIFNFGFVSIAEEFVYRGIIYNYLHQLIGYGNWPAIIVSTLFFGYQHISYAGKRMFVIATIAGFFYCLVYALTHNLLTAVIVHMITNIVWRTFFVLIPGSVYVAKSNFEVRK